MTRKLLITTSLTMLCALVAVGTAVYYFRLDLLKAGINNFLAERQVAITHLAGLQVGFNHATIAELELNLNSTKMQLSLTDLELGFRLRDFFSAPTVDFATIATLTLKAANTPNEQNIPANSSSNLLLSELLPLLRNFPIADIRIHELVVPQWRDKLALTLASNTGKLGLNIISDTLELTAAFTQPSAMDTAQLDLILKASNNNRIAVQLALQAADGGYQLTGESSVDVENLPALLSGYTSTLALSTSSMPPITTSPITTPAPSIVTSSTAMPLIDAHLNLQFASTLADAFSETPPSNIDFSLLPDTELTLSPELVTGLSALTLSGAGTLAINDEHIQLSLQPGFAIATDAITTPAVKIANANVTTDSVVTLTKAITDSTITIQAEHLIGTLRKAEADAYVVNSDFHLRDIQLTSAAALTGSLVVESSGFTVNGPQAWLPAVDFTTHLVLNPSTLAFNTKLLLRDSPTPTTLQINGSYTLASGDGNLVATLPPLTFGDEGLSVAHYFPHWPYPADLLAGTVDAELKLRWQQTAKASATTTARSSATSLNKNPFAVTASLKGKVSDVAGFYGDLYFRGLNIILDASVDSTATQMLSTPPLTLTVAAIDIGIPVTNVAVDFQLDHNKPLLKLSSAYGELLGGSVSSNDVQFDFSRARNNLNLHFTSFRLEDMLTLADYSGVEAHGAVSGILPLTITSKGVEVAQGSLFAEQPGGSIRYVDGATLGTQSNAALNIVNQALSNYQFESLESSIDYQADGELLLAMKLKGHNPDMNKGQSINLNLNLSDNIPVLLKSLQAGRAIEDFLQKQYK